MIIITEEILKNSEKLSKLIENEKNYLNTYANSQQEFKSILIDYMQKFADSTEHIDSNCVDTVLNFLENLKRCLNLVNENLSILSEKTKHLDILFESLYTTQESSSLDNAFLTYTEFNNSVYEKDEIILKNTIQVEELLHSIFEYSDLQFCNNTKKNIVEIEPNNSKEEKIIEEVKNISLDNTSNNNNDSITTNDVTSDNTDNDNSTSLIENTKTSEINENTINDETTNNIEKNKSAETTTNSDSSKNITLTENTLLISETKGKVILPYSISSLEEMLKADSEKYINIENIIEEKYTLPISSYKNPSIARFREAFRLVRDREKSSIKEAFDLGMELLFNYNLHPAIITACKTLDELDIYLDYLEDNETDKFDCFKIVFDIAPVVVKNKK